MDKTCSKYRKHLQELIGQLRVSIPGTMKGFGLLHQESVTAALRFIPMKRWHRGRRTSKSLKPSVLRFLWAAVRR